MGKFKTFPINKAHPPRRVLSLEGKNEVKGESKYGKRKCGNEAVFGKAHLNVEKVQLFYLHDRTGNSAWQNGLKLVVNNFEEYQKLHFCVAFCHAKCKKLSLVTLNS
ncbi:hypothetical protein PGB90_005792 [Kerria lacca]